MAKIKISIEHTGVVDALMDYLAENIEILTPAMFFGKAEGNDRATVDSVSLLDARLLDGGVVEIDYEYAWSFFSGCKDISDAGIAQGTIKGRIMGGHLEFTEVDRPEPRSTYEEY